MDRARGSVPPTVDPRYGLFLFGRDGRKRVWAVLDKSVQDLEYFDRLFIDFDAAIPQVPTDIEVKLRQR